jgi:hypothetical protein
LAEEEEEEEEEEVINHGEKLRAWLVSLSVLLIAGKNYRN